METAMSKLPTINADFLEAGSGPAVMLVHSSVSGARMWRRLMDDLKDDFHVRRKFVWIRQDAALVERRSAVPR
jgi:hypothetical protein